ETRCEIIDPIDGYPRPVAGLILPYASAVGSGGLARLLPNQWDMCLVPGLRLHRIPDAVEEFTGFCKGADLWGGDYLGYGPMNNSTRTPRTSCGRRTFGTASKNIGCSNSSAGFAPDVRNAMSSDELLLRRAIVFVSAFVYWVGVAVQARRIRRQIGRSPNVRP